MLYENLGPLKVFDFLGYEKELIKVSVFIFILHQTLALTELMFSGL